jgi:uncharacterized protein (TIGR03067 family)
MHRLTSAMCAGAIIAAGIAFASAQPAGDAQQSLQGSWTAVKADNDGKPAGDLVGHRLAFTGSQFEIKSKDGKPLYAGTFRLDPSAKPAAIDFDHTMGTLSGKSWKGIYVLDGKMLTICDNAPKLDGARPTAFGASCGAGYTLITFTRAQ